MLAARLICAMLASGHADAATFTDTDSLRATGATLHGPVTDATGAGRKAIDLRTNGYATLPTSEHFDPTQGSVSLSVRPAWPGDAKTRQTFFHVGENDARSHVTIFKTESPTLRFVYKSSPDLFLAADLPIAHWQPGEWHDITVAWMAFRGQMALGLKLDDGEPRWVMGGAPLAEVPEMLYVGRRGPAQQFSGALLADVTITGDLLITPPYAAGPKPKLSVNIDCASGTAPLPPVHDCVTIWNRKSNPLPFTIGSPKHRRLREAGFKLARLVASSETWLWGVDLSRNAAGQIEYDFTDFDNLLDLVGSAGLDAYIRIAYHMPRELSAEPDSPNWAYSGPRDWDEYRDYVRAVVHHCNVERKLGVKYWVMSVNEADIAVDKHGADWDTICKLYEASVQAGLEVDPTIKVGGPAVCKPLDGTGGEALRRFVAFCAERDLPLDFICFHRYHVAHPREFGTHIEAIREIVAEANPDIDPEYFLDEWSQWGRDRHADDAYGAAYIAASLQYFRRAGLTKASIVSFNDNMEFSDEDRDLVVHQGPFPKTDTETGRFLAGELTSDDVKRRAIVSHAPQRGSYTFGRYAIDVPTDAPRLVFGTGITARYQGMDGVGFNVTIDGELVFDHYQRTGAWVEHEVTLADYAGDSINIELRTDRGREPTATTAADWASWAEPRIITADGTIAFDFIELIDSAETGIHQSPTKFVYSDDAIAQSTGLPLIKGNVVTAPYFVFLAQSKLVGNELPTSGIGEWGVDDTDAAGVMATGDADGVHAMVWTFDLMGSGERTVELRFADVPGLLPDTKSVHLRHYIIDDTHTNAYHTYVEQGETSEDGSYNVETAELELMEEREIDVEADGSVAVEMVLPDFSVSLIELEPVR